MSKRAPRRSDEEWRQIILEARSCGGSDFEYCRSHGIPHSTFYRALARLRQHACELPARPVTNEQRQEVVPVNISELPLGEVESVHSRSALTEPVTSSTVFAATMRIVIGGSTLELTNHADPAVVGCILQMLRSSC